MRCSGCGKDVPFTGDVCPYCHRDKSKDQTYTVFAMIFGVGLSYVGYELFDVGGLIGGFFLGCLIAAAAAGLGKKTQPPEVRIANEGETIRADTSQQERLIKLKELLDRGLIDEAEYKQKKKEVIDAL